MDIKKKTIILILFTICLVFFTGSIHAIEFSEKGIKTGINLSNTTGEFVSDPQSKLGVIGGFFLVNKITQKFSLQTELLYSMKGYLIDDNGLDIKTTFTYLQLPLLLKYILMTNGDIRFDLLAGPSINYNLSAKYDSTIFDINYKGNINDFKDYDLGANFGLSFQKIISDKRSMIVDLRYEFGLIPWDELDKENFNRTLSILIGISI